MLYSITHICVIKLHVQFHSKKQIEKVEEMHKWLMSKVPQGLYAYDENDMKKTFEFMQTVLEYVEQPSPTSIVLNS